MRSTSACRELTFVFVLAAAGLALVLAVAFTPWYPADPGTAAGLPAEVTEIRNAGIAPAP